MGREHFYKAGSFYRVDDRTGFTTRAERTQQEWNGLIVSKRVWEIRQPQDFVKGVPDEQTVPQARPVQTWPFESALQTFLTVAGNIGDSTLTVNNTARMYAGDSIQLVLDGGGNVGTLSTTISHISSGTQMVIGTPLPWTAAVNNVITNLSAISQPNIG